MAFEIYDNRLSANDTLIRGLYESYKYVIPRRKRHIKSLALSFGKKQVPSSYA